MFELNFVEYCESQQHNHLWNR